MKQNFYFKDFLKNIPIQALFLPLFLNCLITSAEAAETSPGGQPAALKAPTSAETLKVEASDTDEAGTLPEKVDVQAMRKRYWTVGNEDLMNVVQNRLYTKKGRIELGARYGFYSDDPFQNMKTYSGSLGYHLNEFLSFHVTYAKVNVTASSAFKQAQAQTFTPVVNAPKSLYSLDARASLLYGKLSVLGKKIIYYDFNLAAGLSKINNRAGDSPIGYQVGAGQQIYLTRTFFLTFDYRLLFHTDRYAPTGNRSVTTNWIQVGAGMFLF